MDHATKVLLITSPAGTGKSTLARYPADKRGRPNDIAQIDERLKDVVSQLSLLEADFIDPNWVIDTTNATVEDLYAQSVQDG